MGSAAEDEDLALGRSQPSVAHGREERHVGQDPGDDEQAGFDCKCQSPPSLLEGCRR